MKKQAIEIFLEKDDKTLGLVISRLNDHPVESLALSDFDSVFDQCSESFLDQDEFRAFVSVLGDILSFKYLNNEFNLGRLIVGLKRAVFSEFEFDQVSSDNFSKRVETVLNESNSLYIAVKGRLLLHENTKLFVKSKIITAIRPIFKPSVDVDTFLHAVLYHRLKISYYDDHSPLPRIEYFTLDKDDLLSLKEEIDRALRKDQSTRNQLVKNNFTILN